MCIVPGCSNTGDHLLPPDPQKKMLWIECIRGDNPELVDWLPRMHVKYLYLCRGHFKEDDYQEPTAFRANYSEGKRKFLKRSAVPSVFPWSQPPTADPGEEYGLMPPSDTEVVKELQSDLPTQANHNTQSTTSMASTEEEDSKRQLIYSSIISQHADHLLTKLYVQFIKRRNCDLTIKLSDMYIYAHTCVVDAFTDTGKCGNLEFENKDGKSFLDLGPFQCDVILPLVEMMYTGELAVIPNLVDEVAQAAKFIGFQEAYKGCEVYMKLHKTRQGETEQYHEPPESKSITPTTVQAKTKISHIANSPDTVTVPALHVREPKSAKAHRKVGVQGKVKGRQIVKGEKRSKELEQEIEKSKIDSNVQEPNTERASGKKHGKTKANKSDTEPKAGYEIAVRIKEEPVDDFEESVGNTGIVGDEVPIDWNTSQGNHQHVEKTEDHIVNNSSGIYDLDTENVGSFLDGSKAYAGKWAQNSMNKNRDYVCEGVISKNVYTVLPCKPTESEIYSKKKRGRPLAQPVPTTDDYLNNSDNLLYFGLGPNNSTADTIPPQEQDILDKVAKEFAQNLSTQVNNKRNSQGKLKVKLKDNDSELEKKRERKPYPLKATKVEDGSELSSYGNTFVQVKKEKTDDEYEHNDAGIQADSEIPEVDGSSEWEGESIRRRSKRRRTSRQTKRPDYSYDYDTDSDDIAGTSSSTKAGIDVQNEYDYDEYSESARNMNLSPVQITNQSSKDAIINPVLLKGSRYIGEICSKVKKPSKPEIEDKDSKKNLKKYLDSIGLNVGDFNNSESESEDSDQEHLEIDAGTKVIEPNVTVPKGTRSRYLQPTVAQVKHRYVRKKDGELKKVASIVKTKPKIFQGHQKKPNAGPVFVMCHPTKPIVRL